MPGYSLILSTENSANPNALSCQITAAANCNVDGCHSCKNINNCSLCKTGFNLSLNTTSATNTNKDQCF